jgi:toxin FitB
MACKKTGLHVGRVDRRDGGGNCKAPPAGAKRRADDLTAWLDTLLHLCEERVLPFDVLAARIAGVLADLARSKGEAPGFADVAIAAPAKCFGFTILTTNLRHYQPLAVPFLDPLAALPPPAAAN